MQFLVCSPGVLKDYLRELPYPLITKHLYEAVLESMATRPLRMGASGCENEQADSEHTVSLLDSLPEVEKVRTGGGAGHVDHRSTNRADLLPAAPPLDNKQPLFRFRLFRRRCGGSWTTSSWWRPTRKRTR